MPVVGGEGRGARHRDRGVGQLDQGGSGDLVTVAEPPAVVHHGGQPRPRVRPVHLGRPAGPAAGDAAPSSPAQRAAAGTRARARSVKISAAWNADAADSP